MIGSSVSRSERWKTNSFGVGDVARPHYFRCHREAVSPLQLSMSDLPTEVFQNCSTPQDDKNRTDYYPMNEQQTIKNPNSMATQMQQSKSCLEHSTHSQTQKTVLPKETAFSRHNFATLYRKENHSLSRGLSTCSPSGSFDVNLALRSLDSLFDPSASSVDLVMKMLQDGPTARMKVQTAKASRSKNIGSNVDLRLDRNMTLSRESSVGDVTPRDTFADHDEELLLHNEFPSTREIDDQSLGDDDISVFSGKVPPSGPTNQKIEPEIRNNRLTLQKAVLDKTDIIVPTEVDVLCEKGTRSTNHPGNQCYLKEVKKFCPLYKCFHIKRDGQQTKLSDGKQTKLSDGKQTKLPPGVVKFNNAQKTMLTLAMVKFVHDRGGRFLRRDSKKQWYVVDDKIAFEKAAQALRDDNDPKKRAAKRQRCEKKRAAKRQRYENNEA
jgi:hypothetical protein